MLGILPPQCQFQWGRWLTYLKRIVTPEHSGVHSSSLLSERAEVIFQCSAWPSVSFGYGEEECFTAIAEMLEAHPSGILGLQFCSKTMRLGSDEGKKNTVPALKLTNRPGWPNHLIWGMNYFAILYIYIYEVPEMSKYARIGYEIWWDMELKDMNDGMMVGMICYVVWYGAWSMMHAVCWWCMMYSAYVQL